MLLITNVTVDKFITIGKIFLARFLMGLSKLLISLAIVLAITGCDEEPDHAERQPSLTLEGWNVVKHPLPFTINPRDLFFINAETGFVVGYNGDIYKTIDAGQTWVQQNSGTSLPLLSVYFLDENTGFITGMAVPGCLDQDCDKGSVLLKTNDGGESWSKSFFENYVRIYNLQFFNETDGLATIEIPPVPNEGNHLLARTTDGGSTWQFIDLDIKTPYQKFSSVNDVIFIIGQNQEIFQSNDHGLQWKTITTPVEPWNGIRSIYFINENTAFMDGTTSLYKTTDGGSTWEMIEWPFDALGYFHFYNESEGFNIATVAAYEGGHFPTIKGSIGFTTHNGGLTWDESVLSKAVISITELNFPLPNMGYGINGAEFFTFTKKD